MYRSLIVKVVTKVFCDIKSVHNVVIYGMKSRQETSIGDCTRKGSEEKKKKRKKERKRKREEHSRKTITLYKVFSLLFRLELYIEFLLTFPGEIKQRKWKKKSRRER